MLCLGIGSWKGKLLCLMSFWLRKIRLCIRCCWPCCHWLREIGMIWGLSGMGLLSWVVRLLMFGESDFYGLYSLVIHISNHHNTNIILWNLWFNLFVENLQVLIYKIEVTQSIKIKVWKIRKMIIIHQR